MKLEMPDDWFSMIMDHQGYSDTSSHIHVYNSTSISIRSIRLCEYPHLCVTSHSRVVDWNWFFLAYLANDSMMSTGYTVSFVPLCSPCLQQTFAPVLRGVLRCSPGFGWKLQCWVCGQFEACWGIQQILKINSVAPAATLGWVAPVSLFFFGGLETSQQKKGSFGFHFFFTGCSIENKLVMLWM